LRCIALRQLFDRFAASLFSFKAEVLPEVFSNLQPLTSSFQISWWSYRGGHTRSHPEHGS
jgi:hypothetical protein